ncbi:unnamed protein product [Caenorhabditis angaria]|uniref:UBR-type domain-containing protein n=1 Tax=Caenorhabditis angaria TaxID=860376 RepID=A0A9P1I8X1_9PELO|nr:unnamed protein product [Caenorhabditis angaria]
MENENENDPIVTLGEVMEDMKRHNETAEILFGAQDETVCTYPEGYKPRQTLFSCLTCTPPPKTAGICYGCSLNCHADHDLVELYTKRSFKCDCGNSKFPNKCTLYEEKSAENEFNVYNHNYSGKFCICDDTYPSEKNCEEDMLQCEFCEDWFHPTHVDAPENVAATESSSSSSECPVSFICPGCYSKNHQFLKVFDGSNSDTRICFKNSQKSEEAFPKKAIFVQKLRQRLCKCEDCKKILENHQCEYLLDEDDDLTKFEQEGKAKAEENRRTENEEMRELVQEVGMDGAINILGAVNDLKRKLGDFFTKKTTDGEVVKVEDVKKFFDDLKEQNLEAKRARMQ